MENTVVGVYDSYSQAQSAMNDLAAAGFSRSAMRLNPESETSAMTDTATTTTERSESGIGHFFRSLFGMEDDNQHHQVYSEAVRRGSCVLMVDADTDEERDRASDIMSRYNPVDIDERSSSWRTEGWSGYDASAPMYTQDEITRERDKYAQSAATGTIGTTGTAGTTGTTGETARIPVVEEELKVGKREVQRGGVRVFQRIKETPVHESVNLREEHVTVDRQAVDKPASEADFAGIKEGTVEMRETAEEPVVEKTARVVEEVVVSKDVSQRTEQIDDTVRKADVEVEQLGATGAATPGGTIDDADFRRHWQSAYGVSGGRYEDYDDAYRYGSQLSGTDRFRNYRWEEVEPDVRRDWESRHPGSTWDKVKDAVRYGVERAKGSMRH